MATSKKGVAKKRAKSKKTSIDAEFSESVEDVRADSLAEPVEAEATGSCRYADTFGQMQCESPVTKTYCDGKSGQFVPNGRC